MNTLYEIQKAQKKLLNNKKLKNARRKSVYNDQKHYNFLGRNSIVDINAMPSQVDSSSSYYGDLLASSYSMPYEKVKYKLTDFQLWSLLFKYFFEKNRFDRFTCSKETTGECVMKKSVSAMSISNLSSNMSTVTHANRCYFTSIQIHASQVFRNMDKDFDNKLTFNEFHNGVNELLFRSGKGSSRFYKRVSMMNFDMYDMEKQIIEVDESATRSLFNKIDVNSDGYICFGEFIKGMRIPMCKKRISVLNEAFDKIDINKDGLLDRNDLKYWLKNSNGYYNSDLVKIDQAINSWMSNLNYPDHPFTSITRKKFHDHYLVFSSTVINDAYFDLLIRAAFNL